MPLSRRATALAWPLLLGCQEDLRIQLRPPWLEGAMAIVSVTDEQHLPRLDGPLVLRDQDVLSLTLVDDRARHLEVEVFDPDRLAPNGEAFSACSFSFSGEGNPVEAPVQRFRLDLMVGVAGDAGEWVRTSTALERPYPLRHQSCRDERGPRCEGVAVTLIPWPNGNQLHGVAALDDERAVVSGERFDAPSGEMELGILRGAELQLWPFERHGLYGFTDHLSAARGSIWGVGGVTRNGSTVWRVGEDGTPQPHPDIELRTGLNEISACSDGAVFLANANLGLFSLSETSSTPRPDLVDPPRRFFAVGRARMAVVGDNLARAIRVFDGRDWHLEWERPLFDGGDLKGLAGDEGQWVVVGSNERVMRRNEVDGTWWPLPKPNLGTADVGPVATLGTDQIVLAGDSVSPLLVWQNGWCELDVGPERHYRDLSRAPSGRTVYAVGDVGPNPEERRSFILRIELTE